MSYEKWYNMKDVSQDLARASGQSVRGLNEKYVVVGGQRPKYNNVEDEFEELNMYDKCNSFNAVNKPDLRGITQLIRMVDEYSSGESYLEESENIKRMKDGFNKDSFVISKLNPGVPDFVPQHCQDTVNSLDNKALIETKDSTHTQPLNDTKKNKETFNGVISNSKINISSLDSLEKEKLQERLRSNISNTSKTNCVKVKRQRNLAIATLMKLLSSSSPKTEEKPKPKLITPQYFESTICDKEKSKEADKNVSTTNKTELNESNETESHIDNAIEKVNKWFERGDLSPIVDNNKLTESQNTSDSSIKQFSNIETNDVSPPEVKTSIEKVNNWLNSPRKQYIKSPELFMGPITYKRKLTTQSLVTQTSSSSETPVSETIQNYVPSAYASELSDRYMKRMKEREVSKDMWTKLEEDLKLKDKIIRNKSVSSLES